MAVDASLVGARGTSSSNTVSTTGGLVTTGDTLVAVISYDPGTTITSVSDTAGNSYGAAKVNLTTGYAYLACYVVENATGNASNVLTVNFSGTAFPVAHLIKVTGAAAASYDSGSLASGTDSTDPFEITSGSLAQAASVVISAFEGNRNGTTGAYSIGGSWSVLSSEPDAGSFWTSAVAKLVVASTSAVTPSWQKSGETSPGVTRGLFVVAFKEAAAGSPATLSSPTPSGTIGTSTTATIGATTDQTTGTFYAVVGTGSQLTGVTAAQIKLGQKADGSAALASDSNTVTTTSATADITGLSASTAYTYAAVQNNANGDSNVVTGTFTTASGGGGGGPTEDPISACYPVGYYE